MICKKCSFPNPENNRFCVNCGSSLSEPVFENSCQNILSPQKTKSSKLTVVFLVLAIISFLLFLGATINSAFLQTKNNEYLGFIEERDERIGLLERDVSARDKALSDYESQLSAMTVERNALLEKQAYSEELLSVIASEENWGYATENFHVDKGIMVIDRFGGMQELRIFSTYYTTFSFENSNPSAAIAKWSDKEWTEKDTAIYIAPVSSGYTVLTFTNKLYNNSFKVLIIVK